MYYMYILMYLQRNIYIYIYTYIYIYILISNIDGVEPPVRLELW